MSDALVMYEIQRDRINARQLQAKLGSTRDHSTWVLYQVDRFQFVENKDFGLFPTSGEYSIGRGQPQKNYWFSINAAKLILLAQNSPEARAAHQELIRLEDKWNTPELIFARALQMANESLQRYEQEKQAFLPKAIAHDRFIDGSRTFSLTQAARRLNVGRDFFIQWLQDKKHIFLYCVDKYGRNVYDVCAKSRQAGWVEVKSGTADNSHNWDQVKVTSLGLSHFATVLERTDKDGTDKIVRKELF
jgi:anti-repressor protein